MKVKNTKSTIYTLLFSLLLLVGQAQAQKTETTSKDSGKGKKDEAVTEYEKKKDFTELRAEQKLDKEEMFKATEVPAEWQDESVVLLAYKLKQKAVRFKGYPSQLNYLRMRFKLNDMSAVEGFSDYGFDDGDLVEIKIIKADGKTKKVNLDEAVSEGAELKMNKSSISLTGKKKKIALKDLEVGDIVDFCALFKSYNVSTSNTYYLQRFAPTVAYKYEFHVLRSHFAFAFKPFNGCPEYTTTKAGEYNIYAVEGSMMEKEKPEILGKASQYQPFFKYHLLYTTSDKKIAYYPFKISRREVKTGVTEEELKYSVNKDIQNSYTYSTILSKYKKKTLNGKKPKYDKAYFENFYYYLREALYLGELAFADEYSSAYPLYQFFKMAQAAKLDFEYLVAIPKNVGTLDDVLFGSEVYRGFRIHFPGEEPFVLFEFGPFAHANEFSHKFEGTQMYVFKHPESLKKIQLSKETFPVSSMDENQYTLTVKATVDQNLLDTVHISQQSVIKGHFKDGNQTKGLNYYNYYVRYKELLTDDKLNSEEKPLYFFPFKGVYEKPVKKLIDSEEERIENVYRDRQVERVKKVMKAYAEDEFELHDYTSFNLISDGRSADNKTIAYEEQFKIGGILDKAESGYVLHIGKIFGRLADVSSSLDRKDRKTPFFIDFNRSYMVQVQLILPAGVKVGNLSQLRNNVDNEVGTFSVEAVQNGNVLDIKITKAYKSYRHEATQWDQYLQFSDAGAAFINKKLILTR
jgi:hypothetical protein